MSKSTTAGSFPANLTRVMEALNLSRVALARELGVDKSVVGRWLAGVNEPTGHNLTRLTDIARRHWPDATVTFWKAPDTSVQPEAAFAPARTGFGFRGLQMQRIPTLEAPYVGLWAGFMQSVRNRGIIAICALNFYRSDDGLRIFFTEGRFWGEGPALTSGGRMNCFWEMAPAYDRICSMLFNGVFTSDQIVMDGLALSAAGDASGTPGAVPMIFFRVSDDIESELPGGMESVRATLGTENAARQPKGDQTPFDVHADIAPASLLRLLAPRLGVPRDDGMVDHNLRMPSGRALSTLMTGEIDDVVGPRQVRSALRRLLRLNGA